MRRLCLTLLCGLVAVPAALAASHAAGDGVLEVSNGAGVIVLNSSRGIVWGQIARGRLVVTDPVPTDGSVFVSGGVSRPLTETVTAYSGRDLHFRVTAGRVKLVLRGFGMDLTAVGVGSVQFTGDAFSDPGTYALNNDGKWKPLPVYSSTPISFGVQPAPAP
jgi:hypothetical protein